METVEYKFSYSTEKLNNGGLPVIIVAAGSSTRMNGINKQLALVSGVPVIARTLLAFERCKAISRIILVAKSDNILEMQGIAEKYNISKLTDIVEGGTTRGDSVNNGLTMLTESEKKALIHDGARPLVTNNVIEDVCKAITNNDAVIPVIYPVDTIKTLLPNGDVNSTIPRNTIVLAQTPQAVDVLKYKSAISVCNVAEFTDDASIMESAGFKVAVVNGNNENIKITTSDDISLAEFYLERMCLK